MKVGQAVEWYKRLKYHALCIDIETTHFNGSIAVLGAYRPAEGLIHSTQLIRGRTLDALAVAKLFAGCKMVITFNGASHDLPKIRAEFPGAISHDVVHLDLFQLASQLELRTSLAVLEQQFSILREEPYLHWKRKAIALWKRYKQNNCERSLQALLAYNQNDCVNLYPLAESLVRLIKPLHLARPSTPNHDPHPFLEDQDII